ncbi:MAG: glycogen/starch synthase [Dysgonamonadaceae bacterium]|jgi:hypothetical protein|nr:glycogen/starch synthase [Dysgonamonadaceae bacterium]
MLYLDKMSPDYIFESGWEVCNKVGGIYTVLSTKAKTLQSIFKDKIIFIGPDIHPEKENLDFIEDKTLFRLWKKEMEQQNLKVRVGRWNIPGKPIVILVDFKPVYSQKDCIYFYMWENYKINSMLGTGDYDESCMFAYSVGLVIESLYHHLQLQNKKVIAHLNEWMMGMAALYLHNKVPSISTVFTTHATSIGRSIAGNNKPLYNQMPNYNGNQMARELQVEGKHYLEKATAHNVDCFTTVSEITGKEAAQLLEKNPDIITPNGFEDDFVPKGKKYTTKQKIARDKLIQVTEQLTGETIPSDAFLIGTGGRYEYRNKGLDLFVESVNKVRLSNPERFIVAFILVPAWIAGPRKDLQERLQKKEEAHSPLPEPYYTHDLMEKEYDRILSYLYYLDFLNRKDESVKMVFIPSYLHGDDGIFNMSYYDLLIGLDLTVFPSYYEPWGYTPLESIAFHIPTITTNLAGFGLWAASEESGGKLIDSGVEVIERTDTNYFDVAEKIKETIIDYSTKYPSEKIDEIREAALNLSEKATWTHFITYYLETYNIALRNTKLRIKK